MDTKSQLIENAVEVFIERQFVAGDVVTMAWLEEHLEIPSVPKNAPYEDWRRLHTSQDFFRLRRIDEFRKVLLTHFNIALSNVRGEGYRIVPSCEQAEMARDQFDRQLKSAYAKARQIQRYTDVSKLSDDEQRAHVDACMHVAGIAQKLKGFVRLSVWQLRTLGDDDNSVS